MRHLTHWILAAGIVATALAAGAPAARPQPIKLFDPAQVNNAALRPVIRGAQRGPAVLRAQILLDRAHFSGGEIDGATGNNFYRAVTGYRTAKGLSADPIIDAEMWKALNEDTAPALVEYTLTAADVAGPFEKLPEPIEERAKLKVLGYESLGEALGEKFHSSPALIAALNPKLTTEAGQKILAPAVAGKPAEKAAHVDVVGSRLSVEVYNAKDQLIALYPASVGSEHDPLPVGDWKVTMVKRNPKFHYNPQLFWDAKETDTETTLPPGPNGPVGTVWIGLTKEFYGIHGTSVPGQVGYAQSHGCIRLTNWDAEELAGMVAVGTPVIMREK